MSEALIIDGIRTPIGSYGGSLAAVRPDNLAAHVIQQLTKRVAGLDLARIDDVILGCANQAGEDNRNIARMALLLAGLPVDVPGETVNRLCASGLSAVARAAQAIKAGEGELFIAGGVESMTRAPYVMNKPDAAFSRSPEVFDTSIGWRFVNPQMRELFGVDSMGETAENVALEHKISRSDQDTFALWSQQKAKAAQERGRFEREISAVELTDKKGNTIVVAKDEFPRPQTTLEALSKLRAAFRKDGSVTAGNSSGINDGACALLVASEEAAKKHHLQPRARVVASAVAGVTPRVMGLGPVPAVKKVLDRARLSLKDIGVIELNEAFAAQSLGCTRQLGLADDDSRINQNGGAIALGHPLGMSGARLVLTAMHQLEESNQRYALCTMCVGVGQGMATIIERL